MSQMIRDDLGTNPDGRPNCHQNGRQNDRQIAAKIAAKMVTRIATKTAAFRMASLLDESPGQTVGYRMRLDTKISKHSRIEVITEGILTRMLQQDPSLEDVSLVIFDEFHERSLDSDLALSLCLKGRAIFRDDDNPLKILIMSATIDGEAIAQGPIAAAPRGTRAKTSSIVLADHTMPLATLLLAWAAAPGPAAE